MTSLTKTKAAKYDLHGIEDMVPTLWSPIKVAYDRHVALGTSYWGPKRQRFYGYATNKVSKHDVYSNKRIMAVTNVKVNKWYGYGHLEEIKVRRSDQKLYKFMEDDFPRLYLNDIEDMLLLVVENKLFNLDGEVIVHLVAALLIFTRQPYIAYSNPKGVIYLDKLERNRLMCTYELYKFSDGTLISVWDKLKDMANNLKIGQNRRDLPKDIPLDSIEVLSYDTKGVKVRKGKMQSKTELTLEQTQQGVSDEVLEIVIKSSERKETPKSKPIIGTFVDKVKKRIAEEQEKMFLKNELPSKEKDLGSFILPFIIGNMTVSNALADLGASISVMPFSLFKRLGLGNPKPIRMLIEMVDKSMQSPKRIIENVLVKIDRSESDMGIGLEDFSVNVEDLLDEQASQFGKIEVSTTTGTTNDIASAHGYVKFYFIGISYGVAEKQGYAVAGYEYLNFNLFHLAMT
ncbi:reverse transcriptase domain-containing protein [Tanacetum coccineum]